MLSALFYFLYFAAFGIYIPYWTLYLKDLNLSAVQIATIYAIPSIARIFLPPIYGYLADRFQERKTLLRITATGQLIPLLLLFHFHSYESLLILVSFFSLFNAAVLPFTEATVQEQQEKGKLDYGRTRLWGTLSFILIAATFGKIIERFEHGAVLAGFVFMLALVSLFSFFQPVAKPRVEFSKRDVQDILKQRNTWVFLGAVFLMHLSHGTYYGFLSIHLADLGYGDTNIGIQWAAAAASELLIFFFASFILSRFKLKWLFQISLLLAAVRWLWVHQAQSYLSMTLSQSMHAFSFGLFHIAAMKLTHAIFREGYRSIGQSLFSSIGWGLGSVFGVLLSGYFWSEFGAKTFLVSSAIAMGGFLFSFLLEPGSKLKVAAEADRPLSSPDRSETVNEL